MLESFILYFMYFFSFLSDFVKGIEFLWWLRLFVKWEILLFFFRLKVEEKIENEQQKSNFIVADSSGFGDVYFYSTY